MTSDWSLVSDVEAWINKEAGHVVFVPFGNKKERVEYLKKLKDRGVSYAPVALDSPEFSLKVINDTKNGFNLSCEVLGEWYSVENFDTDTWGGIITQVDIVKGNIQGSYEVVVSDSLGLVSFVNQDMEQYDTYFDEMVRRMSCRVGKKTKKWVPGHRYDSEDGVLYYLGEFKSRKDDPFGTEFLKAGTKAYIAIEHGKRFKKVSEALISMPPLRILSKPVSMVDAGQALEPDVKGFNELWGIIIPEFYKNLPSIVSPSSLLPLWTIMSLGESYDNVPKDLIEDMVRKAMLYTYINQYDVESLEGNPKSGKTVEENIDPLIKSFIKLTGDFNVLAPLYYPEFFSAVGISLEEIAKDILHLPTPSSFITENFDTYLEWGKVYFEKHEVESKTRICNLRTKTGGYGDKVSLAKLFGDGPLTRAIIDVAQEGIESYGLKVSYYRIINMGTVKCPREYVKMRISLMDIVKTRSELPENLKNDIITNRFQSVSIEFDKDGILE